MGNDNIYLRDAGALLSGREHDYLKRLFRCTELAASNKLNIQITLSDEYFSGVNPKIHSSLPNELLKFDNVLIHLHLDYSKKFGDNRYTEKAFMAINNLLHRNVNVNGFCVHPDIVDDFSVFTRLTAHGAYIGVEVLDASVCFGNRFSEISRILEEYEFLDLILDTSHILEMEKWGEPSFDFYVDYFGDKIKEVHISRPGNHYDPKKITEIFSTCHSLFSTNSGGVNMFRKLQLPKNANYVIEGVIPYGKYGDGLLRKETRILKARF